MRPGRQVQGASRQGGRRLGVGLRATLFIVGALFAAAAPAAAYFSVGVTTTSSYSAAVADSLNAGNTPTLGSQNGENVTLNWTQSTIVHDGQGATGYTIARYNVATGGTATAATGGCAGTNSALTCTEQNVTPGNWWYTVTPLYHAWTGAESGRLAVTVSAPTFSITSGQSLPTTGGTITGGTISHFGNSENVTFHLDSAGGTLLATNPTPVTTNGSGAASVTSITIPTGQTAGTHTIVAVGATSGLTATSNTFSVFGTATKLVLSAQTTTPTAGAADNLTITAEDSGGNTVTSYTGSKNLTFGGASVAPNGTTHPTVTNSSGTATNFGSTTAINFVSGQATVQTGGKNGVMTLYDAQTTLITVTDGAIGNGSGLSVTVAGAGPASLALANCVVQGTSQACNGSYALGNAGNMVANVQALDTWGNGATITTAINMSVTSGNTGNYTITAGSTLTIDGTATPPYQSNTTFTVHKTSNASNSTTITVHVTSGPSLTDLTFTVTK